MLKLVLHNILKHKFLFILIGIMVIVSCVYLIVGINLAFSISKSLRKAVAENMTGDLIITSSTVKSFDIMNKDGEERIIKLNDWGKLLDFTRKSPFVACATPRLRVLGSIKSEYNQLSCMLIGVDPVTEPDLLPNRTLDSGRWLATTNEVNLYYRHSDLLSITNNNEVLLSVNTLDGYMNANVAKLVGTIDYKDVAYYTEGSYYVFVSLDYLNQLLQSPEPLVSEILVRLKAGANKSSLEKSITKEFGNKYRFIQAEDSASLISGINKLTNFCIYFVAFILLLMVFLCSSFLISLSIENRRQEIGIYQALGVQKWRVGLLFGFEFLIVLFVFGIIGVITGMTIINSISVNGIEASIIPLQLIFGRSILYVQNQLGAYIIVIALLLLTFVGNTLLAIIKLGSLDPVEVMRDL